MLTHLLSYFHWAPNPSRLVEQDADDFELPRPYVHRPKEEEEEEEHSQEESLTSTTNTTKRKVGTQCLYSSGAMAPLGPGQ